MINFPTLLSACLAGFTAAANINYGDEIVFQNAKRSDRWLSGARANGNGGVITRDRFGSSYEEVTAARTYKWTIRSTSGNGQVTFEDPKAGACLKYGDIIYLQNNFMNNRWLTGSRDNGNENVKTLDHLRSNYEQNTVARTYEWIVRSNLGSGALTQKKNKDSAFGQCVQERDQIFLQNNFQKRRWLSGARGNDSEGVITRNRRKNKKEKKRKFRKTYKWTVRKATATNPTPTPAPATPAPSMTCDPTEQGSVPGQGMNSPLSKVFRALNLARCHHGLPHFQWRQDAASIMGNSCNNPDAFDGQGHMNVPAGIGGLWTLNWASQANARGVGQWYSERSVFENQGGWHTTSPTAGHFLSIVQPIMVEVACAICPSGENSGLYCNMRFTPVPTASCGQGCLSVGDRADYQHTVTRPSISQQDVIAEIQELA